MIHGGEEEFAGKESRLEELRLSDVFLKEVL